MLMEFMLRVRSCGVQLNIGHLVFSLTVYNLLKFARITSDCFHVKVTLLILLPLCGKTQIVDP